MLAHENPAALRGAGLSESNAQCLLDVDGNGHRQHLDSVNTEIRSPNAVAFVSAS